MVALGARDGCLCACACCIHWALFRCAHAGEENTLTSGFLFQQGYHWDTSDWMPSVPLPDIQEFPNYEVIDEQTPLYSADPNAIDTDYYPGGYDIESDFPPPPEDFPGADELPPLPPEFSDQFESIHPPRDAPAAGSPGSTSRGRSISTFKIF